MTRVNLPEMLKILKPVYNMTKGIPTDAMLPSTYWRKKDELPSVMNPEMDGCGLMWCAPIAPTSGKHAKKLWEIIESVFDHYDFEPAVTMTLLTERTMDCVVAISYDRSVEGEDERAKKCHDELLKKLTDEGYYPYRLGVQSMAGLIEPEESYTKFINSIKTCLDPKNILSPRRYSK